jgi:hypothetical protein
VEKERKKTVAVGLLLSATTLASLTALYNTQRNAQELEKEIAVLRQHENRYAIDRSISVQMEEIAYEQKEISDEQREQALQQTRVANEMRHRSEIERQNAIEAERNAVASERKALIASAIADSQRVMAEHQRMQAEFSKRVADTLSYIALGRSLGSISTIQEQVGNHEIADLLAYAAYHFTSQYRGDVYNHSVYQALMSQSRGKLTWTMHRGVPTNLIFLPGEDNKLVTISNYGEIVLNEKNGNNLKAKHLFNNSNYDFRDILFDKASGSIYCLSTTGHIVVISNAMKTTKIYQIDNVEQPIGIQQVSSNHLLVISKNKLGLFDMRHHNMIKNVKLLPFNVTAISRKDNSPLLFDDKGKMHLVKGIDNLVTMRTPVEGKVTAYCESKHTGFRAYGMSDGTIYLQHNNGRTQKLVGHRSRISKMKMNGRRLYSTSYDGSVNLWVADNEKIDPITLLTTNGWIMNFTFDSSKSALWLVDAKGSLTEANMSVDVMVKEIKKKLKRDLTREEWNYFIGRNVPYESFTQNNGKEARQ